MPAKVPELCKVVESEACKLLGDEVRRKIVQQLRGKELSICQIGERLNMTSQAVYHHIKKLEKAGLVQVTREERHCHLIESYYQATAETFICCSDEIKGQSRDKSLRDILKGLDKIGFKMEINQETLLKMAEIQAKQRALKKLRSPVPEICVKCGSGDFFLKSGPMDLLKLDHIYHYANLIAMTDEEYEESVQGERELRHFLLSICQEKQNVKRQE